MVDEEEVGTGTEVGAVVLLELPHAVATSSTPSNKTAPDRTGLRRAQRGIQSMSWRETVAHLVVSP